MFDTNANDFVTKKTILRLLKTLAQLDMYAFPLSDGTLPFKVHPMYSHQGSTFQQIVTLLYFQKLDWYLDSDDFHVSNIFYQVRLPPPLCFASLFLTAT